MRSPSSYDLSFICQTIPSFEPSENIQTSNTIDSISSQIIEEEISPPVPKDRIINEVNQIKEQFLLFESSNFSVICAPSDKIPNLLIEIGREREIAFRAVGEGTGKSIDIDEYDTYYHQMFIWDNSNDKLVGAYRVGKGKDIMNTYGVNGFYAYSIFNMLPEFYPILEKSLELGRSFIVEEYQRKPIPLFLLWKGILCLLLRHHEYKYLIGPVSISNSFSEFSKGIITEFIRKNYYRDDLAKFVKPRNKYNPPFTSSESEKLLNGIDDLAKLDKLIQEIEPGNSKMPVLLKKYLKQSGHIVAFSDIDPSFNYCIDGMLVMDIDEIPNETMTSLAKELKDFSLLSRFPDIIKSMTYT